MNYLLYLILSAFFWVFVVLLALICLGALRSSLESKTSSFSAENRASEYDGSVNKSKLRRGDSDDNSVEPYGRRWDHDTKEEQQEQSNTGDDGGRGATVTSKPARSSKTAPRREENIFGKFFNNINAYEAAALAGDKSEHDASEESEEESRDMSKSIWEQDGSKNLDRTEGSEPNKSSFMVPSVNVTEFSRVKRPPQERRRPVSINRRIRLLVYSVCGCCTVTAGLVYGLHTALTFGYGTWVDSGVPIQKTIKVEHIVSPPEEGEVSIVPKQPPPVKAVPDSSGILPQESIQKIKVYLDSAVENAIGYLNEVKTTIEQGMDLFLKDVNPEQRALLGSVLVLLVLYFVYRHLCKGSTAKSKYARQGKPSKKYSGMRVPAIALSSFDVLKLTKRAKEREDVQKEKLETEPPKPSSSKSEVVKISEPMVESESPVAQENRRGRGESDGESALSKALLLVASRLRAPGSVNLMIDLVLNEVGCLSFDEKDVNPVRQYLLEQLQSTTPSPTKELVLNDLAKMQSKDKGILELDISAIWPTASPGLVKTPDVSGTFVEPEPSSSASPKKKEILANIPEDRPQTTSAAIAAKKPRSLFGKDDILPGDTARSDVPSALGRKPRTSFADEHPSFRQASRAWNDTENKPQRQSQKAERFDQRSMGNSTFLSSLSTSYTLDHGGTSFIGASSSRRRRRQKDGERTKGRR
jgi:hypothetical protein